MEAARPSLDAVRQVAPLLLEEKVPEEAAAVIEDKRPTHGPTRVRRMRSFSRGPRTSVEQLASLCVQLQSLSCSSSSSQSGLTGLRDVIPPAQRTEVIHKARDALQRKLREEEPYTSLELVGMAAIVLIVVLLPLAFWYKFQFG